MSEIDSYRHRCIGIVFCPSAHDLIFQNGRQKEIPIYQLEEDAFDATSFRAKRGDLLLGGGSGESAALRISIPEALNFFSTGDRPAFESLDEIYHPYWTMNDAFVFGDGYSKLGWTPHDKIESWLTEHILAFALHEYPEIWSPFSGSVMLEQDGTICRLPNSEERQMLSIL